MGTFQSQSAYVAPGTRYCRQTNLDPHRRQSLCGPAWSDRNAADRILLSPPRTFSSHAGGGIRNHRPVRTAFWFWNQPRIGLSELLSSFH
jgi:hypothetical protein